MLHIQILTQFIILILCQGVLSNENETKAETLKFKLRSGALMPAIGLGTAGIKDEKLVESVLDYALEAGYRQIDTAAIYKNEEQFGKALKTLLPKHNLTRKDIFITTKLAPQDLGDNAYEALKTSLKKLDCDYIDLYLIHWPGVYGSNATYAENNKKRDESWQQLVKGVKDELIKDIGVSNYNIGHLKDLLANDHGIKPTLNQVEWHPHYHKDELLDFCNKEGIQLEAYSSLGGTGNSDLLEDPEVKKIAQKLGKSPAQVLLKWALQQNVAVIPKARSQKRIQENINLDFTISEDDMKILSSFPQKKYIPDSDKIA